MKKGFTLIELIIAIVLLGIVSGIGVGLLGNVFTGYYDTRIKNFLYNEAKFTFERIDKEIRDSVPNSIKVNNNILQYVLFKKSFYYEKNSGNSILIYDNLTGESLTGKYISIYNLSYNDIFTSNINLQKIYRIIHYTKITSDKWLITFNKNIIVDSPYNRCFLIDTPVTVYKLNDKLIRCFGYTINSSNGINNGICNVLTSYVKSVSFDFTPGNTQKNSILKIYLTLFKSNLELKYNHEVHLRNVP